MRTYTEFPHLVLMHEGENEELGRRTAAVRSCTSQKGQKGVVFILSNCVDEYTKSLEACCTATTGQADLLIHQSSCRGTWELTLGNHRLICGFGAGGAIWSSR